MDFPKWKIASFQLWICVESYVTHSHLFCVLLSFVLHFQRSDQQEQQCQSIINIYDEFICNAWFSIASKLHSIKQCAVDCWDKKQYLFSNACYFIEFCVDHLTNKMQCAKHSNTTKYSVFMYILYLDWMSVLVASISVEIEWTHLFKSYRSRQNVANWLDVKSILVAAMKFHPKSEEIRNLIYILVEFNLRSMSTRFFSSPST